MPGEVGIEDSAYEERETISGCDTGVHSSSSWACGASDGVSSREAAALLVGVEPPADAVAAALPSRADMTARRVLYGSRDIASASQRCNAWSLRLCRALMLDKTYCVVCRAVSTVLAASRAAGLACCCDSATSC